MTETKYIVLGKVAEDDYAMHNNVEWIVKGFHSLESAQKFIDRLSLDLVDSKTYIDMEEDNGSSREVVLEENTKLVDRFLRKYGHNVFYGDTSIVLNKYKFLYRVERIEFEDSEEDDEPITKSYERKKDEY